jgi:phage/plasmid-associated DNA primase
MSNEYIRSPEDVQGETEPEADKDMRWTPKSDVQIVDAIAGLIEAATLKTEQSAKVRRRRRAERAVLKIGDDVELAQYLADGELRDTVYSEDEFWRYDKTHWRRIPKHEMSAAVRKLSGMEYGERGVTGLSAGRIKSVLEVLADILAQPDFFTKAAQGLNAANGFITFDEELNPKLISHSKEHCQRHVLPGHWHEQSLAAPPEGSLLHTLLTGVFREDPQAEAKIWFLQQIAFVVLNGSSTKLIKPKAIVLLGRTAENGKSQVLDMMEGLLPPEAVSSIPPHRFDDDNKMRMLIGVGLNTSGELSTGAIAGDRFKEAITGGRLDVRGAYRPEVVQFRPQALQLLAGNKLPPFKGGFDRGVKRRLAAIDFLRIIPEPERIVDIGRRIAREEPDLLLAWALGAASHILRERAYEEPPCSKTIVDEWTQTADPVLGWIADRVLPPPVLTAVGEEPEKPRVTSAAAFADFRIWYQAEEGRPPTINQRTFTERLQSESLPGVRYIPGSNGFRGFEGLRLAKETREMQAVEPGGRRGWGG